MKVLKNTALWKKIVLAIIILIAGTVFFYWDWVKYGTRQLSGQMHIIMNTVPVNEVLADSTAAQHVRDKLVWIRSAKKFAEDSAGLKKTNNYVAFYDAEGAPLLWVVNACPPFSLESHKWEYPVLGKLGYKGFFDRKLAEKEADRLKNKGFDTDISEVTAWSTLGILPDPILSTMLKRDSARLAELIIHELSHATFYIPGKGGLNENTATFIGREGAKRFLKARGLHDLHTDYEQELEDKDVLRAHLKKGARSLSRLYASFDESMTFAEKESAKKELIFEVMRSTDTLSLNRPRNYSDERIKQLNNTFFTGYLMYQSGQDSLRTEFEQRFNGDLKAFVSHFERM